MNIRDVVRITAVPAIIASLCCLSPVLLFSAGIVSLTAAADLADVLYGEHKWVFRAAGAAALCVFLAAYFRRKKICTFGEARRKRNEVMNAIIGATITAILLYIVFLYGAVEWVGIVLGLW